MDSQAISELESELQIVSRLSHPHIVKYLGHHRDNEGINIYMEYMPGGNLEETIECFKTLNSEIIKSFSKQILQGINYLHSRKIQHRDIKSSNILLDTKGVLKIADFGCA